MLSDVQLCAMHSHSLYKSHIEPQIRPWERTLLWTPSLFRFDMKLFGVQVQTNAFAFIPIEEGFSGGKRFHQKIIHGVDSKVY